MIELYVLNNHKYLLTRGQFSSVSRKDCRQIGLWCSHILFLCEGHVQVPIQPLCQSFPPDSGRHHQGGRVAWTQLSVSRSWQRSRINTWCVADWGRWSLLDSGVRGWPRRRWGYSFRVLWRNSYGFLSPLFLLWWRMSPSHAYQIHRARLESENSERKILTRSYLKLKAPSSTELQSFSLVATMQQHDMNKMSWLSFLVEVYKLMIT